MTRINCPVSLTLLNSLSPVSLTPLINIHSRISLQIFQKIQNGPIGVLGGGPGDTDSCKNMRSKISCQTPFKGTQDWEFLWPRFWNLRYFLVSYVKILRFYKKKILIGPLLREVRFFFSSIMNTKYDPILFFLMFLRWAGPRPHIPFPPDLILYVNLVAMGPVHLSPVTWPQAYSIGFPLLRWCI